MEISRKKYLIFSFDGGGARMVLQYQILKRIIAKFPQILEKVHTYAGTSAGAILATGLATGAIQPQHDIENLVSKENVAKLFDSYTVYRKIKSLNGLKNSKYTNDNLKKLLKIHFGEETLVNVPKCLFVTAFCVNPKNESPSAKKEGQPSWMSSRVNRWHPVYYTNITTDINNLAYGDKKIVDIILESTAAPTYFPIKEYCIDGGIGNNNPSLSVLTKVMSNGIDIKDIFILSFGSGERPIVLDKPENADMGTIPWLSCIIDMLFDAEQEVVSQNAYQILGDNFWRIQPVLDETIELDDASKYDRLLEIANNFDLTNTFKWLENF